MARWLTVAVLVLACGGNQGDGSGGGTDASTGGASASGTGGDSSDAGTSVAATTGQTTGSGAESSGDTAADSGTTAGAPTRVVFETTAGTIVFELDEGAAPITSANFLAYVDAGFFDGADGQDPTIFHRVVPGFVIQGGGLTETLVSKPTMPAIVNESGNGLTNVRGAISMARTDDPDSATSQFFVNLVDNAFLDTPPGYAVFGRVVEGLEVVDAIAAVPTETMGPYEGVPVDPIVVTAATRE